MKDERKGKRREREGREAGGRFKKRQKRRINEDSERGTKKAAVRMKRDRGRSPPFQEPL